MKRYEFYRNQKITVIDCRYFSFEAENLETAVQKIKELCADGQLDELSNDPTYQEDVAYQIPGTEYPLDIENNNGIYTNITVTIRTRSTRRLWILPAIWPSDDC